MVNALRMMLEERLTACIKIDLHSPHNEVSRAANIVELEAEPTLRHLAWHAATVLAPNKDLEIGGVEWGDQEGGKRQGAERRRPNFRWLFIGM